LDEKVLGSISHGHGACPEYHRAIGETRDKVRAETKLEEMRRFWAGVKCLMWETIETPNVFSEGK